MSTVASLENTNENGFKAFVRSHPLVAYFVMAYAGMWIVVSPLVFSSQGLFPLPDAASFILFVLSSFTGPTLAAYVATRILEGKTGTRQLFRRCLQWRAGLRWYLVAVFGFAVPWLIAIGVVYSGKPIINLIQNPSVLVAAFLPQIILGMFIPSLGEEPGWRGFALPRLQAQYGPVSGTIILGLLHSFWHLLAFFTPLLGPFTPGGFLAFLLTGTAATFIYTWVFNNTHGSIFIAMLIHAAGNAATGLVTAVLPNGILLDAALQALIPGWLNVIVFGATAILIVVFTNGNLSYKPES